ncbi:MAG: tRNA (adenosine(37)-N6)-threonylcarbamoyltransferase complex transferase subunit TsaD, partial [Smithellaceae bacterium]
DNGIHRIVVCGGVAANGRLREKFAAAAIAANMELFIPPAVLCTDNAAMIAAIGEIMLVSGRSDSLDLNAVSRWPLT